MNTVVSDNSLVNGYLELLENLSTSDKLDLIARLSVSVKTDINHKENRFKAAFGAWEDDKTADEMIAEIRNSRILNRQIEAL